MRSTPSLTAALDIFGQDMEGDDPGTDDSDFGWINVDAYDVPQEEVPEEAGEEPEFITLYRYFESAKAAKKFVEQRQSLGGSGLEQDDNFVSTSVDRHGFEEASTEIEIREVY